MTFALIRKADNTLECFVETLAGTDVGLYNAIPVSGDWTMLAWDGAALAPRAPTTAEQVTAALDGDADWSALKDATPAQIAAWLDANVTNLATARRVLKVLLLVVRQLALRR